MQIAAHLRSIAKKHALRRWFDGKNCPQDDYFTSVDGARVILRRHSGENGDDPDYGALAPVIAHLLNREGVLYAYVDKNDQDVETPEQWEQVCLAAAWVVLDRYDQAVTRGDWPKP